MTEMELRTWLPPLCLASMILVGVYVVVLKFNYLFLLA